MEDPTLPPPPHFYRPTILRRRRDASNLQFGAYPALEPIQLAKADVIGILEDIRDLKYQVEAATRFFELIPQQYVMEFQEWIAKEATRPTGQQWNPKAHWLQRLALREKGTHFLERTVQEYGERLMRILDRNTRVILEQMAQTEDQARGLKDSTSDTQAEIEISAVIDKIQRVSNEVLGDINRKKEATRRMYGWIAEVKRQIEGSNSQEAATSQDQKL